MPKTKTPDVNTLILFCNQRTLRREKLNHVYLTEDAARAREALDRAEGLSALGDSYAKALKSGDIVHLKMDEPLFRRIEKTGVVFIAFKSNNKGKEAIPYAVASSRNALVTEARKTFPLESAESLFDTSRRAGSFLLEGYPAPAGWVLRRDQGRLLSKDHRAVPLPAVAVAATPSRKRAVKTVPPQVSRAIKAAKPKASKPKALQSTAGSFYAHQEPGITPKLNSEAAKDGRGTFEGGGWWRGCPHMSDTQEFADWQAGWHRARDEATRKRKLPQNLG